jgi:hypothetical protein
MNPILLDDYTFWEVVGSMIVFFFWMMAIWIFISLFADIFRRRDLSGWGKAGWIFLLFILPFIGALIYIIARPKPSEEEIRQMQNVYHGGATPATSTDDIAKAHELLKQGALTQAEYDQVKARALGTG